MTLLLTALLMGSTASTGLAQGAADDAAPASRSLADLPVTRVVLFTSGVGYFEHSGTVTGDQDVELTVAADDMDDLLQSLVLQDFDGGTVRPVRYGSNDPLERILSSYSLDLSGDPTLAELLAQARGEVIHVEAARPLDGTIVNVEQVEVPDAGRKTYLTLLTADGLQRLALDEVRELRFEREALRAEFDAALGAIARYRGTEAKPVVLRFEGDGTRRVSAAYVREMPVWKTSYRLVVGDDGMADLQGWAIFDNPTNLDLKDVAVSFVAGQPISFITDLYEPVYVRRPHVSVSTAPSIVPPAYAKEAAPAPSLRAQSMADSAAPGVSAPMAAPRAPQLGGAGVTAMAEGVQTGATFEYRVDEPVTIGRHESAMLPILQQRVPARLVSVYDRPLLAGHPLRGVRLVNDTGLHLAPGPVTVFGESGFSGNAQLGDVVAGDSRLLTYAVDLDVDVLTTSTNEPQRVASVVIRNGLVETSVRQRLRTAYRFTTSGDDGRFVVVEHAKVPGYVVVEPTMAPAETQKAYRFGVAIGEVDADAPAAGAPAAGADDAAAAAADVVPTHLRCDLGADCTLEVVVERTDSYSVAIANVNPGDIALFLQNAEVSEADRATFTRILDLKQRIVALDNSIAQQDTRVDAIHEDQDRIRQNMGALDRNASLYRRYVSDLEAQENELDQIGTATEELKDQRQALQDELDELIRGLGGDV